MARFGVQFEADAEPYGERVRRQQANPLTCGNPGGIGDLRFAERVPAASETSAPTYCGHETKTNRREVN